MADSGEFDGACSLKSQLVPNIPGSIYYIPEFISEEEEEYLIRQVNDAPKPKWTQLLNRRLQNWGGLPHQKGMVAEPIPEWLNRYCSKITDLGVFEGKKANHVLVNEYKPGQGIMPHLDGDLYYPTVSTITLGSHTLLNFYRPLEETGGNNQEAPSDTGADQAPAANSDFSQRHLTSILLERRSLVLVKDDMFHTYLHGITEVTSDTLTAKVANLPMCTVRPTDTLQRSTRISLTIRHVPKVLKLRLGFGRR